MESTEKNLSQIPLFSEIQETNLEQMLQCVGGYVRTYNKGEYVSLVAEKVTCVGVVLKGTVHMLKEDIWGNKTILSVINEHGIFGETFACGNAFTATVSFWAASDLQVLFLPFNKVMTTCSATCEFHQRMIQNMVMLIAHKNIQLMEKLEITSKKTLREKILTYLSLQAQKQNGKYIIVPLGRLEMADYLGVNRSALTRELSNMKADGLIDYDKNTFQLL